MSSNIRVRFAPSPTGYLHVGGARTALYDYLYAKRFGGEFILRVEDTDQERSTEESMKMQLQDLKWLGLNWDEGVVINDTDSNPAMLTESEFSEVGEYGPYRQSQRLEIYKKYADQLLESGRAYYCFLTDEEIDAQREQARRENRPPQVNSPYKNMSIEEAKAKLAAGEKAVVRFKTEGLKKDYIIEDLIRGEVKFPSDMVGDFVLLRSNGMPVYNFCCAIDDALMKMTHVLRAEEHLSNTLRQMMIYEALEFEMPKFGHLSIILGPDKQKLSKRHGATSCNEYREKGYLPEAILNYIAMLGWSHPEGKEILSRQELIDNFSLERVNPASAVFDEVKLKWVNASHLRALDHKTLWSLTEPFLKQEGLELPEDPEWQDRSLGVFKTSMETLKDAVDLYKPISSAHFQISEEAKDALSWESTKAVIEAWKQGVSAQSNEYMSQEDFEALQNQVKESAGVKGKHLFMPIRVAVIGKPHGAELKMLVPLMAKSELLARADKVLASI